MFITTSDKATISGKLSPRRSNILPKFMSAIGAYGLRSGGLFLSQWIDQSAAIPIGPPNCCRISLYFIVPTLLYYCHILIDVGAIDVEAVDTDRSFSPSSILINVGRPKWIEHTIQCDRCRIGRHLSIKNK